MVPPLFLCLLSVLSSEHWDGRSSAHRVDFPDFFSIFSSVFCWSFFLLSLPIRQALQLLCFCITSSSGKSLLVDTPVAQLSSLD